MNRKITSTTAMVLLLASLSLAVLFTGCSKKTADYTDSKGAIQASVGEKFNIVLDSNRTTGYEWRVSIPLDTKIVTFEDLEYQPENTSRVGAGGKEVWTFKAAGKGTTRIFFEYLRPWEEGKPPADTKTFKVQVK